MHSKGERSCGLMVSAQFENFVVYQSWGVSESSGVRGKTKRFFGLAWTLLACTIHNGFNYLRIYCQCI